MVKTSRTSREDIKDRFAMVAKAHLSKWDNLHPVPSPPHVTTVLREMRQGKARANARKLAKALNDFTREYGTVGFLEVVTSPSIQEHTASLKGRKAARVWYETQLEEAKNSYLDRVLFDHESPFLLITDFKTWHPRATPRLSVVRRRRPSVAFGAG